MRTRLLTAVAALGLAACAAPQGVPAARDGGTLVLMGTTDVHGWLLPYDYYTGEATENGLARLVPSIDSVRAANPGRTVLVDSGDLLQGNPLTFVHSTISEGEPHPVATAMNLIGYDAAAIGNHEFNYGIEHLDRVADQTEFPFLSANVFIAGTDRRAYTPYTIVERDVGGRPVRIGLTAVTPPGVLLWDRDNVAGRLDFRGIVESIRPVVAEMRDRGADLVVVASHGGLEGSSYDTVATGVPVENAAAAMARDVPGIDVIFMGHTHRELADTTIAGTMLLQAKNWATSLAVAELELERAADEWRIVGRRGRIIRPSGEASDPAFVAALTEPHERTREYVGRVVGTSPVEWSARTARVEDTPILDLINEVQRRQTGADLSSTAAFSLSARIPAGPVTIADLAGLYVYDNTLKAIRVSGAELRAYLEKSAEYYLPCPAAGCERAVNPDVAGYNFDVLTGVDYTLDVSRPVGQRVVRLERNGAPVEASDSFTLALNNYRASGAGGFTMLADAPVVYDRGEGIRELLIDEIAERATLDPDDYFRRNWELVPEAAREQALREQAPTGDPGGEAHGGTVRPDAAGSAPKRLRVLGTNDFHGALQAGRPGFAGGREVGGAATLAAYFNRERTAFDGPTVIIDAGDVMQGTPISNLTEGRATVEFYNRVGYTAAALGNHEFDWGIETLRERIDEADFAWLGANIYVKGTDTLPSWVRPTTMVTLPGCAEGAPSCDSVSVGIIGIATEQTPTVTKPSNVATLTFGSEAEAIDLWVPRLREAGADFVIVTAHSGAFCDRSNPSIGCEGEIVEVARRLTQRPDLIVSGHTHSLVNTVVNGVRIVQANSSGTRFSVVDLERVSSDSTAVVVRDQPTTFGDLVAPDAAAAELVARFETEVGPRVREVVTMLDRPLTREGAEYPLGNLIADAQRAATGTQISIMNNGGIRTELLAGPVRYEDLFRLQPFANTLVTMVLTGEQLSRALEQGLTDDGRPDAHVSGITVRVLPDAPVGARIAEVLLDDGEPVRPEGWYTVTVNDFMAEGGSGFSVLTQGADVVRTGLVDLDALIDHLRDLPTPVPAPRGDRWRTP